MPIRLDIDHDHYRLRDTFVWNVNGTLSNFIYHSFSCAQFHLNLHFVDPVVSIEKFAQVICDDFHIPQNYFCQAIMKSINEQIADAKNHALEFENTPSMTSGPSYRGALAENDDEWWESWRKKMRTDDGHIFTAVRESDSPLKRKLVQASLENEDPMEFDPSSIMTTTEQHEELRILIKVSLIFY